MTAPTPSAEPTVPAEFSFRKIALPAFGPSLLFGLGEGAILPIVPLMARDLGASVAMAAFVVTLISLGSLLNNVPASLITMRWGERGAIIAAGIWSALGMALSVFTHNLALFAAGCFMVGMSQAVYNLARQSYLTEAVPALYRARALSTLGGVMRIGMFIGPFLAAGAIHMFGVSAAFAVGIVGVLCAAAVGARLPDLESPPHPAGQAAPAPVTLSTIIQNHRHVFLTLGLGVMLVSAVRSSRQAVIPLWADHLALAPAAASLIYGLSGGVEMLLFYPAGRVMDIKGRRWVAVPSMAIIGSALLLMPWTTGLVTLLMAAMAVGIGNGIGSGLIMTLGADNAPRHGRAYFLGVWRFLSDVGGSCGPALLSALVATVSLAGGIFTTGLLAMLAAALLGRWIPARTPTRQ
ncbi:Predicted arabinose efflux permease, MFS family [Roseateles sp. YR242]|uniref:MFS transporter n=1 Tax=Roseateles sp. YR242 TaxID=1855305 RepID=UPI0008D649B5|nr:MFS transporter [Roseateles sp. YR242]SEK34656.1 Predicted arabinose efflux permease, MFS family [Roseateles sp. YR242]